MLNICCDCHQIFVRKKDLRRRERTLIGRVACPHCGTLFDTKPSLQAHIRLSHQTEAFTLTEVGEESTPTATIKFHLPKRARHSPDGEAAGHRRSQKPEITHRMCWQPVPSPDVASKFVDLLDQVWTLRLKQSVLYFSMPVLFLSFSFLALSHLIIPRVVHFSGFASWVILHFDF